MNVALLTLEIAFTVYTGYSEGALPPLLRDLFCSSVAHPVLAVRLRL